MKTSEYSKVNENVDKHRRLVDAFFAEYRKDYITPDFDLCSMEFRRAITNGVVAAVEEWKRMELPEVKAAAERVGEAIDHAIEANEERRKLLEKPL